MLIPKDATVFFPPHTLHHFGYTNPRIYNPDRFTDHPRLAMDYAGSSNYQNRDHYAYGGGRRICVGIHLAERTQWRITAKLLWAFRILPALDEDGKEIKLDIGAYTDGLVTEPMPYRVRFVPRSERHVEVINKDFEDVREFLAQWEEKEEKEE
jgi:cytochrome P450